MKREDLILHKRRHMRRGPAFSSLQALLAVALSCALVSAQTKIVPPDNKYTPAQDVEFGLQAAPENRQKLPNPRGGEGEN